MPNPIEVFLQISVFAKLTMAVAIAAFGLAVSHVRRPTEQKLALMRPVSLASIFATISGLFGGWIAVLGAIAWPPDGHLPASSMERQNVVFDDLEVLVLDEADRMQQL